MNRIFIKMLLLLAMAAVAFSQAELLNLPDK
jgi:hypothetical protein